MFKTVFLTLKDQLEPYTLVRGNKTKSVANILAINPCYYIKSITHTKLEFMSRGLTVIF